MGKRGRPSRHEQRSPSSEPDDDMGEEEYEVEKILDRKHGKNGNILYSVKWVGWEDPTWEEEDNLTGCEEKLAEFEKNYEGERKDAGKSPPNKDIAPPVKKKTKQSVVNNTTTEQPQEIEMEKDPADLPPEREAEEVMGATDTPSLAFLVRFKSGKNALVEKKVCRDKYPRLLCDFLLDRVQMTSPEPGN